MEPVKYSPSILTGRRFIELVIAISRQMWMVISVGFGRNLIVLETELEL